jgi:ABC-2 type transport system permease protein
MNSLIIRIIKQIRNDKRSLALMMLAPLMILTFINLLLGEREFAPIILIDKAPNAIVEKLKEQAEVITDAVDKEDVDTYLAEKKADAVLSVGAEGINIRLYEADSYKTEQILRVIRMAAEEVNPQVAMKVDFVLGNPDMSTFDSLSSILLAILSFFFVFLIAGISFIRERTTGTLERLMQTPIKRREVVAGYTIGFGIFSTIQSVLIIVFVKYVLRIEFTGSVLLACIVMILLAVTAVSLGALVSIFANTEFQIIQFVPIVIVPQIFLSGLIPIDTIPLNLGKISYVMPIYYGSKALKEVLLYGAGIDSIIVYVAALVAFIVLLYVVNTLALKRYRII